MAVLTARAFESNEHEVHSRRRPASNGRRRPHRRPVAEPGPEAPIVTVFLTPDGRIHHTWCDQPLDFQGRRAGVEVDFFCLRCMEHVTLPESILPRVPVRSRLAAV